MKPDKQAIGVAAQTLGRTMNPKELREFLQGKFVDALRSVAAGLWTSSTNSEPSSFRPLEDLLKTGLELECIPHRARPDLNFKKT